MPGRLSSTWMRRAGMAYQRSGADDGSATLSSPLLERSAKEGSGDGRHRRMARRDLRRASDQRPPPRLLLDRQSVVEGKRVSVSVDLGGRRIIIKKIKNSSNR